MTHKSLSINTSKAEQLQSQTCYFSIFPISGPSNCILLIAQAKNLRNSLGFSLTFRSSMQSFRIACQFHLQNMSPVLSSTCTTCYHLRQDTIDTSLGDLCSILTFPLLLLYFLTNVPSRDGQNDL